MWLQSSLFKLISNSKNWGIFLGEFEQKYHLLSFEYINPYSFFVAGAYIDVCFGYGSNFRH